MTTVSFLLLFCLAIYKKKSRETFEFFFTIFLSCSSCFMQVNCSFRLIVSNTHNHFFSLSSLLNYFPFFTLNFFSTEPGSLFLNCFAVSILSETTNENFTGSIHLFQFLCLCFMLVNTWIIYLITNRIPFQYPKNTSSITMFNELKLSNNFTQIIFWIHREIRRKTSCEISQKTSVKNQR